MDRYREDFDIPVYAAEHYITWGANKRNKHIASNIEKARNAGDFILFLQDEADEGTGEENSPSNLMEFFKKHNVPFGDIISNRKGKEFAALTTASPAHYIEPYRFAQNSNNSNV
ncbi:hypothetical protein EB155_03580, partial [archaeon]|nr:hypothetical protein [archaeon]NDB78924.1 hypothetical protein [archaeon]